jgi:protease-4
VVFAVFAAVLAALLYGRGQPVPARTILEVDLESELVEEAPQTPLAQLTSQGRSDLASLLEALERAGEDSRVVGLVAKLGSGKLGMAQVQELRDAVQRFRRKGKFAYAFAETFGEFNYGNGAYYLATAFEQIWLQPSGDIGLTGVLLEPMFVKGALEKLGVKAQFDQRYEYKNAMNMFTDSKMTAPYREAMEKLAQGWAGQLVRGIAEGRKLDETAVRGLLDRGPFLGPETLKEKLVDQLGYRDELYAKAKEQAGSGGQLLYLGKYLERTAKAAAAKVAGAKTVAMIYGVGGVQRGKSDFDPLSGGSSMGADTVTAAFRAAIADKEVKGILFRIDSPGGSYVASDAIWREVERARAAGKPVIASMGNVAGSGGYFVAMGADKIVAQPGTITGSIGVLGGKFVVSELLGGKLGVTYDRVAVGENAGMWSPNRDFTPAEWARFQGWLDRVYSDFTTKVAAGRKLPKEKVLAIAKGRIWTGEDAKANGLIDELGGIDSALRLLRQAIGASDGEPLAIKHFPVSPKPAQLIAENLLGRGPDSSESPTSSSAGSRISLRSLAVAAPLLRALAAVASPEESTLAVPTVPELR